jgi:hypothetical protein
MPLLAVVSEGPIGLDSSSLERRPIEEGLGNGIQIPSRERCTYPSTETPIR